jgi:AcrR family transcriptional regulator
MPYQVVKRVGKRAYRYEVTSFRDPATGKSKGTWRYLGRWDAAPAPPRRRDVTRERLLDAFVALLAEASYAQTTVTKIARRASVTKATFYRYFRDKRMLLFALVERTKERLNPTAVLQASGDRECERERIKNFLRAVANDPAIRDGIARAVMEMQFKDRAIQLFWQKFMRQREAIWSAYIAGLNEHGVGHGDDPAMMASVMTIIGEGVRHCIALGRVKLSDPEIELLGEVVARVLIR